MREENKNKKHTKIKNFSVKTSPFTSRLFGTESRIIPLVKYMVMIGFTFALLSIII